MGEELLVNERIDAGADFVCHFDQYAAVSVACWIIPAESDKWYLYVALDGIADSGVRDAYGAAAEIWRKNMSQWLDLFQIKLIDSSDRIARDAIKLRDRYGEPMPTRLRDTSLGGMGIEAAYIYPPVSAMKAAS